MKEESQIDAMRAAVRGDLERSRVRFQPKVEPEPEPVAEPEPVVEEQPKKGFFSSFFG